MKENFKKMLCLILVCLFILSLIPIGILAFYNYPANDDFVYSLRTHHVFLESNSFLSVLRAAAEQVKDSYFNWQGTFSAVFLFALQPALFGQEFYALSTFVLLGSWILSTLFLCRVLLRNYCKTSRWGFCAVSLIFLGISIQFLPSPVQGFFWWNGSVYYVFFSALAEVLFGLLLLFLKSETKWKNGIFLSCALFLAAIISGGNYVTALLTLLLLLWMTAYAWWVRRKKAIPITLVLCVFLAGFLISMVALGNAVRALSYPDSPSAPLAIGQAFYYGVHFAVEWTNMPMFGILLLLSPFFYCISAHTSLTFRHPILFLLGSFCLFAAQIAPPCYAMGSYGEGRILNAIYFGYLWFAFFNLFYLCGAIRVRFDPQIQALFSRIRRPLHTAAVLIILVLGTSLASAQPLSISTMAKEASQSYTTLSALYSLYSGEARQYSEEYSQRIALLEDPAVMDVKCSPFTVHPWCLYYSDWTQNPNYEWSNRPLAQYYGKNSVVVIWE